MVDWKLLTRVQLLQRQGLSIEEVAESLEISKDSVVILLNQVKKKAKWLQARGWA